MKMVILAAARVDKRFRVTIPKEVREALKLTENSEVIFFTVSDWKGRVCFRRG
jgi:AbrB family looped-hinge helix DNA binding protein